VKQQIPRHVRSLLAANLVSSVGSGLTLPFLLIYLHQVRHIGLGLTGLLIGGASVVAIPAGPATGSLVDRFGARQVMVVATVLASAGGLGLILVRSAVSAVPALFVYGLAQGSVWPAWNALFAVMVHDEELRPRVFARSFQLLNLGLGLGAVVAGLLVHVGHPRSFEVIYAADALTNLAVVAALMLLPARVFERQADPLEHLSEVAGGYREVLSDGRFRRYLLGALVLAFAGYAAIDTGLVGFATTVVHVVPSTIAWAFAVNTALIVCGQPLALRLTAKMRRTSAVSGCAVLFAISWVVLLAAGLFPRSITGEVLVVAMFGVFSLGEVLLSPVAGPLVNLLARPALQGRYNALGSSVYSVTSVIGPAVAGVMLSAHLGDEYLGLLIGCCAAAAFFFRRLARLLPDAINNARPDETASLASSTLETPAGG
jgi:MFS family permease